MSDTNFMLNSIPPSLKRNWGWMLGLGILFIILGCLGVAMVVGLTIVSIIFMGALFVIAGFAQILDAVKSQHWDGVAWHALIALLYLIGGGLIIYDPILASAIITALIAWILILIGVSRIILSVIIRHSKNWGWILFAGLVGIVLGILILLQWPFSALWVIGLFIAIELIMAGWSYIFFAFDLRHHHNTHHRNG